MQWKERWWGRGRKTAGECRKRKEGKGQSLGSNTDLKLDPAVDKEPCGKRAKRNRKSTEKRP